MESFLKALFNITLTLINSIFKILIFSLWVVPQIPPADYSQICFHYICIKNFIYGTNCRYQDPEREN